VLLGLECTMQSPAQLEVIVLLAPHCQHDRGRRAMRRTIHDTGVPNVAAEGYLASSSTTWMNPSLAIPILASYASPQRSQKPSSPWPPSSTRPSSSPATRTTPGDPPASTSSTLGIRSIRDALTPPDRMLLPVGHRTASPSIRRLCCT
jgi:hypothetical protein